jgi:peptidoglycan/xylan/chitin deacetylase (PgdA/CDA1 family)
MPGTLAYRAILNTLYLTGATIWSRHGGIGAILMLHRVNSDRRPHGFTPNDHLTVTPDFLDSLLAHLKGQFDFVSMDEAARRIAEPEMADAQRRFIVITLDDGYRDNLVNAVPLFRRHGAPYTIFVSPGLVEGHATLWWEDLEAIIAARQHIVMHTPGRNVEFDLSSAAKKRTAFSELLDFLTTGVDEVVQRRIVAEFAWQAGIDIKAHLAGSIMNWNEIAALSADPLCTIGAHTIHHFALARLDADKVRAEMTESARIVEMETGRRPRHFAYPYGYPAAAGPREFEIARECGFDTAVTTRVGVLYAEHAGHLHALPRISVNGRFQSVRHMQTLLSGLPSLMVNRGRALNVA